jgi:PAS domain S-box-containing protein
VNNLRFDTALGDLSQEETERLCIRNLLASPDERIFFKDRDSRFVLVSAGMRKVVEQQGVVGGVIGKSDLDFASEAHAADARADEEHVMETGEPLAKVMHETFDDRPDEWAQTSRLPLRDDTGEIVGTWGITHDVTAQIRAEQALQESELQHRLLFEHSPQPMLAYERNTLQLIAVSNAAVAAYGYSREQFLAMTINDLVPAEDAAVAEGLQSSGFEGAQQWRHRSKDGTIIDVEITTGDLRLDGHDCRVALCLDVTERNRDAAELAAARDQAVEASNMKSIFLANISHEIRTPMTGVLGMTQLLLDSELDEDQRSLAVQVSRSGELLVELINDILDISKIEAGQLELEQADFPLGETIERACAVASLQAEAKGVKFTVQIADDVPQRTHGDGRRLRQILLNLASNAVKFTSQGKITVRASTRASKDVNAASVLRVEVTDSGIGIAPVAQAYIFEPFKQADATTTRDYGGTGLGLAIARELTEMMGGTIGVQSTPGSGSTFWIELPLAPPLAAGSTEEQRAEPAVTEQPVWATPPLVLVAEDNQVNQIVAVRTLERCGCRAEVANDGRQALDMLAAQHYDAVLMDCQMPELDGYEATAELRRRESANEHTPVIAMTAHALDGAREHCLEAGMDDYVSKPINRKQLTAALHRSIPAQTGPQ